MFKEISLTLATGFVALASAYDSLHAPQPEYIPTASPPMVKTDEWCPSFIDSSVFEEGEYCEFGLKQDSFIMIGVHW